MTTDNTYNGWTNYETWSVKLWIDNDQRTYTLWRAATKHATTNWDASAVIYLADQLSAWHESNAPTVTGVYADPLQGALDAVNWREIAQHMLDEFAE